MESQDNQNINNINNVNQNVKEEPDAVIDSADCCIICKGLIKIPVTFVQRYCECRYDICMQCADSFVETADENGYVKCIICRNEMGNYYEVNNHRMNELDTKCPVVIECPYKDCLFIGNRKEMHAHMTKCDKNVIECTYCKKFYKALEINEHLLNCEDRVTDCIFCKNPIKFSIINDHQQICDSRMVRCTICKMSISIKKMDIHATECPEFPMECVFCGTIVSRAKINEHKRLTNCDTIHSILMNDIISEQVKKEIRENTKAIVDGESDIIDVVENQYIKQEHVDRYKAPDVFDMSINREITTNRLEDHIYRRIMIMIRE